MAGRWPRWRSGDGLPAAAADAPGKAGRHQGVGSVLREDFGPESDIDVLVDFQPDHAVGLKIMDLEQELSVIFDGRKVDVVNEKYLNPRLPKRILEAREVQYAEG